MEMFEEQFKTRAQGNAKDLSNVKKKVQKAPSKTSLIDPNKAKNLAITLRKGGMNPDAICTAIEMYVLLHCHPFVCSLSYTPSNGLLLFCTGTTRRHCPLTSWNCSSPSYRQTLRRSSCSTTRRTVARWRSSPVRTNSCCALGKFLV